MDVRLSYSTHKLFPYFVFRPKPTDVSVLISVCDGKHQETRQHAGPAKKNIAKTGGPCDGQIEREECRNDRSSDKRLSDNIWKTGKHSIEWEAGRDKKNTVGGEWVGTSCDKHTSKSDDFREIFSANDLDVFLHQKKQLLSCTEGKRLQFCQDIENWKHGKRNKVAHYSIFWCAFLEVVSIGRKCCKGMSAVIYFFHLYFSVKLWYWVNVFLHNVSSLLFPYNNFTKSEDLTVFSLESILFSWGQNWYYSHVWKVNMNPGWAPF